jgi:tRNA threonylcarbamoyladenosine biosynthesis protein TsaE
VEYLNDESATESLGRRLAASLFPGAIIALVGPLGAGKTRLVRAVAEALGVAERCVVSSPTFVLIQEYEGRLPIFHFDAYRLPDATAFRELGVEEYFEAGGVCLIEWGDRVEEALPADHLRLTLEIIGEAARRAILEAFGDRHRALLDAFPRPETSPSAETTEPPPAPERLARE